MKESKTKGISIFYEEQDQTQVYIHPELTYPEFLQLVSTILLHGMNAYSTAFIHSIKESNIQQKIKSNKHEISEDAILKDSELQSAILNAQYSVHDAANIAVSNVLKMFLPDELAFLDPEQLITNEAILKAELECLESRLEELTPEQKKIAEFRLEEIKEDIQNARDEYAKMQLEAAESDTSINPEVNTSNEADAE